MLQRRLLLVGLLVGLSACSLPERPPVEETDVTTMNQPDMAPTPDLTGPVDMATEPAVATVLIEPEMPEVVIDDTLQLTATALDADGDEVPTSFEWSSSNDEVVDVAASGTVIGVALGSATVTVTTGEGASGSVDVTVVPVPVASIEVAPTQRTLEVGETVQMTVTLTDARGGFIDESERIVEFESDDSDVVTVDDAGLVTGVAPGEATVTVTSEGHDATSSFAVTGPEVERIEVTPATATLVPGDTVQLDVTFQWVDDEVGTEPPITWSSSDDLVATVDAGLVTAVAEGATTITATAGGQMATAAIDVVFDFGSVSAGGAHACALVEKVAFCWGAGGDGQLGHDQGPAPARVQTTLRFDSISAGGRHTCGVATDGKAYCWGDNAHGQLGDGSTQPSDSPVVVGTNLDFASVAAGVHHTCGITTSGQAYCWGRGDDGRLGDGMTVDRSDPVMVGTFARAFAGDRHTCATTAGGGGYCWGDNDNGQLGLDGTSDFESSPTLVTGGFGFSSFSPGDSHTVGVTTSGAAAGWGLNDAGQVGDASNVQRETPILLPGNPALARLTAGAFHSCGLTAAGDAYCWGEGSSGQLGTGGTADENEAAAVSGNMQFSTLDAGADFTCGVSLDADVYCWGAGAAGQLGPGSVGSNTPVAVF